MDKQSALKWIRETFEQPFDEGQFKHFVRNLFNQMDEGKAQTWQGAYVPEAFRDQVKLYKRLGTYTDPTGIPLDVLIVYLKKETALDRARTTQRNFVARYLKTRGEKEAAVVAYVGADPADWRFSLVKMEYQTRQDQATGKVKVTEELSPARRYSFLVGSNEPNHTAQQHLLPLLQDDRHNPTLAELEAAFNIESVTREFFEQYKELFLQLKETLEGLVAARRQVKNEFERRQLDPANFAKKLLGQIVFLYFLQKKGWLGVATDQAWGSGPKDFLRRLFAGEVRPYQNFFNDILEPLFYEALALPRDSHLYPRFNCQIPFLNGGLFEPMSEYDWQGVDLLLPNELFSNSLKNKTGDKGTGILDVFDRYNFTIAEDEPLEKEVAVDPEMLGKVFENLLEVTDRKSKGAFYTPREIVHYMCQESLINYLDTTLNTQTVSLIPPQPTQKKLFGPADPSQLSLGVQSEALNIPRADLETFIRRGDLFLENETHTAAKGAQTETYHFQLPDSIRRHARDLDTALAQVKICDPAIGSGAFPVGMMQEIVKARTVLTAYFSPRQDLTPGTKINPLPNPSPAAGEGVSLLPPAAGGLRGVFSPERTPYAFKRHCIQESLYGVDIDPAAVDIAKLRLWLSLVVDEDDYQSIKPLPNLDYKVVCGNALLGVPKDITNYYLFERIEELKSRHIWTTDPTEKHQLKTKIDELIRELTHNNTQFDFEIYFSEVFHPDRRGFDLVIGNPPYVRQEEIKGYKSALKQAHPEVFQGAADLYIYFYIKGFKILRERGTLIYISSNKYFRAGYGEKLRHFFTQKATIHHLIDFGDAPVFEAIAYPSIIMLSKTTPGNNEVRVLTWKPGPPLADFAGVLQNESFLLPQKALAADGWRLESPDILDLLNRVRQAGKPLGEYVNGHFYYGIKTGLNEAFVVDRATRDDLIATHPSSAEILKPFVRGRDVKRWRIEFAEHYLIKIESSANKKHPWSGRPDNQAEKIFAQTYPAIYAWFEPFRERLINREDQGKYFWELRACVYWGEFEQPKILYPDIYEHQSFTIDKEGFYFGNTCYFISTQEKWLCGLLNSQLVEWFYSQVSSKVRGGYMRAFTDYMKQIPIPTSTPAQRTAIEGLVGYILFLMEHPFVHSNNLADANDRLMVKYFEQLLNGLVYELYFPDELHQAEKQFIQPFLAENLPSLDQINGDKLAELRRIYARLFAKDHPLRRNLFFLDSLEIIRLIEGKT